MINIIYIYVGTNALHIAAGYGRSNMCHHLVSKHGAAVNRTDNSGINLYFNNGTSFIIYTR